VVAWPTPNPLPADVLAWATPTARDWKDSPGMSLVRGDGRSRVDLVPRQVFAWSTPLTTDAVGAGNRVPSHATHAGLSLTDMVGGRGAGPRLNPRFSAALMGFPATWCDVAEQVFPGRKGKQS
jgi:hypothetical protein